MLYLPALLICAVVLFVFGFFPISNNITNFPNDPPEDLFKRSVNLNVTYPPHINRSVLIIIDALRWDFVDHSLMPLTAGLMHEKGCLNKIIAESPTVTLPRIKALTTGNIPQYIDVLRNLASSEILNDSWLHSAVKKGLKIVFYGDNTWEKLYPDFFYRSEGTTSFFVWDFKEVDNNVTRNVEFELNNSDWDIMILHYLGLDHIGHVLGPYSSQMVTKLKEMDEIINKIHTRLSINQNIVTFITGDHGMRDSGGHGGTSQPEITVPLISLGLPCQNSSFYQTDIPANLAVLLGLNIPITSIGNLQKSLLHNLSLDQYLFALKYNTDLLLKKTEKNISYCEQADIFYRQFLYEADEKYGNKALNLYTNCSNEITKLLYENSSKQDMISLFISVFLMLNVLFMSLNNLMTKKINSFALESIFLFSTTIFQYHICINSISYVFIVLLGLSAIIRLKTIFQEISFSIFQSSLNNILIFCMLLHPLSFISTSFIEEEHYFFIYFTVTLILFISVYSRIIKNYMNISYAVNVILILFSIRFSMDLNSTVENSVQNTNNWAHYFNDKNNFIYLQIFFGIGLTFVFIVLMTHFKSSFTSNWNIFLTATTLVLIFLLKLLPYHNTLLGKLIWTIILIQKIVFKDFSWSVLWILAATLLMKPHNVLLISIAVHTGVVIYSLNKTNSKQKVSCVKNNISFLAIIMYIFSNCFYFIQGHRNNLATVDISIGYTGLSNYEPILVISQILMHTYIFPVLFHLIVLQKIDYKQHKKFWITLLILRTLVVTSTCIVTIIFKHHLFIWSVFAPKLFIESVHTGFLFTEIFIWSCFTYIKRIVKFSIDTQKL